FAVRCIAAVNRPALVVAPTIDLMVQWAGILKKFFQTEVGMLGGGSKEILPLTVSTYDSAVLQMEFIGNRFGLIVFDECHHLPGQINLDGTDLITLFHVVYPLCKNVSVK
ncbi:MAG: DEAD/DEAH box helicase family protein, partial [Lentisphaeria bacterium]|nr:DEAD/DEAH box helicase family protein [Lentisphaeria bacterium]